MGTTTREWNEMRLGQLERRMRIGPDCFIKVCSLCVAVVALSLLGCHREAKPPSTAVVIDVAAVQRFEIQLDERPLDGESCHLTKGGVFRLAGRFVSIDQTFVAGGTTKEGVSGFIPVGANSRGTYLSVVCLFRQSDSAKAGPAMSRCAQANLAAKRCKNLAAVTAPPARPATLATSAKLVLRPSAYSSSSGRRQHKSSDDSPASSSALAKPSLLENKHFVQRPRPRHKRQLVLQYQQQHAV